MNIFRPCVIAIVLALVAVTVSAQGRYAGRLLTDVLREMQASGVKVVYSSELVRPGLRVTAEPRSKSPRRILDELLNPHGLEIRNGPNGTLLVVKSDRRAPAEKAAVVERTGNITGRVVNASTAAPLADVMVEVQSSGHSTSTDDQGTFVLEGVPVGRQSLFVSMIGYALARPDVEVQADATASVTVALSEGTGAYTERVTVTADHLADTGPTPAGQQTLGSAALQGVRMVFFDDPLRAVQALPGVAANDDFKSDFSVRGADFQHLGLSIDGVATPWLLHGFEETQNAGSIAMLNSDIFDHVTLASGAYPQRYSDRAGGSLEAEMREGSRQATGMRLAVSGTSASFLGEGPIAAGKGSWLVSFRRSYVDWLVRQVVSDFNDSIFAFTDIQAKMVYDLTPRHQFQATLISGASRLRQENETHPAALGQASNDVGLITAALRSTLGASVIVTQRASAVAQNFRNLNPYQSEIANGRLRDLTYRADVTWMPKTTALVEAGAQYEHQREGRTLHDYIFAPDGTASIVGHLSTYQATVQTPSAYARVVLRPSQRFSITPGARVSRSTDVNETVVSPWIQAQWSLSDAFTLRAGTGVAHQFPELRQTHGSHAGVDLRSERARHADVALEHRITPATHWQVTLYRRDDDRFLRLAESDFRLVDGKVVEPSSNGPWRNSLTGESYGAELLVQRSSVLGLSGWVSYTLGHVRYRDVITGESFDGNLDQRHTMNTFLQYAISSRTNVSAKLRVGSNFPMPGYWEQKNGRLFLSESLNEARVPTYARLDLRVNRVFNYTKRRLTLFAELMNALNRENARFTSPNLSVQVFRSVTPDGTVRTETGRGEASEYLQNLFPRLPSAGILIEF